MSSGRKHVQSAGHFLLGIAERWRHPCGWPRFGRKAGNQPQPAPFLKTQLTCPDQYTAPWAQGGKRKSGQRAKNEILPAACLGGLFGQVRDGLVDFVWTETPATPKLFLRLEVFKFADRLYFASRVLRPVQRGVGHVEFHASLAPIVDKWIDGF
jgi:hypothetical protein